MSGKFLITRPRHDRIVNYLFFWSEDIIGFAKGKNINPIDLGEKKATNPTGNAPPRKTCSQRLSGNFQTR